MLNKGKYIQVKGKDTLVENNYVYSIFKLIEEQELVLTFIKRRSFAYINKHRHASSTSVDTVHTGLRMVSNVSVVVSLAVLISCHTPGDFFMTVPFVLKLVIVSEHA